MAPSSLTLKHVKVSGLALFQRDLFDGQRKGQQPQSNVGVEMFFMVGGSIFIRGYHDIVKVSVLALFQRDLFDGQRWPSYLASG